MSGSGCELLLVEDDVGIGRMLERGLRGAGYRVEWVRTLAEAIPHARNARHRLVVLDRALPDGDGAEFCKALRGYGHPAAICMLTARDALEDKLDGFGAGADDYLTKPFEFEELLARLTVLERRAAAAAPGLRLDAEKRLLVLGVDRQKLTRRECLLFRYFADRAGETVTREDLIANVWESPDGSVSANSVDVYVGYLRRKLSDLGATARIETVRSAGYRYVP